jgi:hypothetical protein
MLSYYWAKKYSGSRASLWSVVLIALGTPVFWYSFLNADMAHIPAFFAISIFVILFDRTRQETGNFLTLFCLGMAGGLAAIIRQQNIVIFVLPFFLWISELLRKRKSLKIILGEMLFVMSGAVLMISLQLRIWQILFGNPLGPIVGKGISETDNFFYVFFDHFYFKEVLFSSYHGLLFFSPILIFSFWGLIQLFKRDEALAFGCLTILIAQIVFTASQRWFWEGLAFGLRQMTDWAPIYILGLSVVLEKTRNKVTRAFPFLCAAWTVLLCWTYANRSMAVLNEYQPLSQIWSWMLETFQNLPESIFTRFVPAAPLYLLLPAILVFGVPGYFLATLLRRFGKEESNDSPPAKQNRVAILTMALAFLVIVFHVFVTIADTNGTKVKLQYTHELTWLKGRTRSLLAAEITEHLLNEARYKALSSGWEEALPSFREAMVMSPNGDYALSQIRIFASKHLPKNEVDPYLVKILTKPG